jgi:hypothetical protein
MKPLVHAVSNTTRGVFSAETMYKRLELWASANGLGSSPAKLLEEFREIRSMDIVLPVKDRNHVRLRIVAKPDDHVRILLQKLGIKIPNRPKNIENVVKTLAPNFS